MTTTGTNAHCVQIKPLPGEFDKVVLLRDFPGKGLERGDVGVVVHVYREHDGYEVEFSDHLGHVLLLTVDADEVELVQPPCTLTTSHPGVEVTYVHDDGPSDPEEDRLLVEWMKKNYPVGSGHYTAPLWMCLAWWWPNCFTSAYFWLKEKFCAPDYIVPEDKYDQP